MKAQAFDRTKHVYRNDAFVELVKDAIRFFSGTPIHTLPPSESFLGTGVYALYYTGRSGLYARYGELNRLAYAHPIYVGKAVPKGWRQARVSDDPATLFSQRFCPNRPKHSPATDQDHHRAEPLHNLPEGERRRRAERLEQMPAGEWAGQDYEMEFAS